MAGRSCFGPRTFVPVLVVAVMAACGARTRDVAAGAPCSTDSECASGACVNGRCASPGCAGDEDCATGERCASGACVPAGQEGPVPCSRVADCDAALVCSHGACVEAPASKGVCEVNDGVDFGYMGLGSTNRAEIRVQNRSSIAAMITVEAVALRGEGASPFAFGAGFAAGDHEVPAQSDDGSPGELVIPVEFTPMANGEYLGVVPIAAPAFCAKRVYLHGIGVESALICNWPTSRVDFGFTLPGAKVVRQLACNNLSNNDIGLRLGAIIQPPNVTGPAFGLESAQTSYVIPKGGASVTIDLWFSPAGLGLQVGRLTLMTDDPSQASGAIELVGVGAGPAIGVLPESLDFDPTSTAAPRYLSVVVTNAGVGVPDTTDDNLTFTAVEDGNNVEKCPEITGADASDFSVEWPPQGYAAVGLAESESADLRVYFAPRSEGLKQATLRIFSNDPVQPIVEVPMSGTGVAP